MQEGKSDKEKVNAGLEIVTAVTSQSFTAKFQVPVVTLTSKFNKLHT